MPKGMNKSNTSAVVIAACAIAAGVVASAWLDDWRWFAVGFAIGLVAAAIGNEIEKRKDR